MLAPTAPLDPKIVARLPRIEPGDVIGPDGPLPELRGATLEPRAEGPGLRGIPADADLRRRLDAGNTKGVALVSASFSSLLPDIPAAVLGFKQERTCFDPTLAEHRRLTLGTLVAMEPWPTAFEGPGTWRFVLSRNPASHPLATDLGIKTQDSLAALRMKCHMRVEAAQVEWST